MSKWKQQYIFSASQLQTVPQYQWAAPAHISPTVFPSSNVSSPYNLNSPLPMDPNSNEIVEIKLEGSKSPTDDTVACAEQQDASGGSMLGDSGSTDRRGAD